ncbi:hypothetical protein OROHE_024622 [Orobanche hederae]
MSSDLFAFENSFFFDQFSAFADDRIDPQTVEILQENHDSFIQEIDTPVDETIYLDQIASAFLSSSPPGLELESLSLSQLEKTECSVKTEECQLNFNSFSGSGNCFSPENLDGPYGTARKFTRRSYGSNCYENKENFSFRPGLDCVFESRNLPNQILSSPESSFSDDHIRRACCVGDLQKVKRNIQTKNVLSSSPLSSENSLMEEVNFKVGSYSAEERKERIDRYRAKKTQRNFNKKIKYACRKTLADNRPRIRGRFARNDEAGDIHKASMFHVYEDDEDIWIDGPREEDDNGIARRGTFFNILGSTQCRNYSY